MFRRVEKFIGIDNLNKIKSSVVAVIGLGGVGGYAVEGLVRSGVNNIIIVDYDWVDISNLNRQLITNVNNIGDLKVDVMERHILSINPKCKITKLNIKLDMANMDELFNLKFDYLIDCCDTLVVKEELIKRCLSNNIVFISSMGTGNKFNPSMLKVMDISKTSYDPIAKKIRKYLSVNKIKGKVPVVCSIEQNDKFSGDIPSMMFVPAVSGILCANYIIDKIIKNN